MLTTAYGIVDGSYVPSADTSQGSKSPVHSKREAEERLSEISFSTHAYCEVRLTTLRAMPVVDLETHTPCLVGAPNVGKSSLVRLLSTAKPEFFRSTIIHSQPQEF